MCLLIFCPKCDVDHQYTVVCFHPISDIFACSFTTIPFNDTLLTAAVLQKIIFMLDQTITVGQTPNCDGVGRAILSNFDAMLSNY